MKIIAKRKELVPKFKTDGSGAFDILCDIEQPIHIKPQQLLKIPTGLFMEIPIGHVGEISERSSAFISGLLVRGKIDMDFRGEIQILVRNLSDTMIEINPKIAICQMQLTPYRFEIMEVVTELSETKRGSGGFGSTDENLTNQMD
jgi:dUTP pyrophosphatase